MHTWEGATAEARVNYIRQAQAHDAIKEQPDIITGEGIVMPSAPYFSEAAASLAAEARSEATRAREAGAATTIARAARQFLVKIQEAKGASIGPLTPSSVAAPDGKEVTAPAGGAGDSASSNSKGVKHSESKHDGDDASKDAGDNKRIRDDASRDVAAEDSAAGEPTAQKVREKVFHEGRGGGRLRVGS